MPTGTLERQLEPPQPQGRPVRAPRGVGGSSCPLGLSALVLVACSLVLASNGADADLWGHVRYGQDVLAQRALPTTATHTFTAADYPWINHENLSEVAFALLAEVGGGVALLVFKCLLGLLVLGLLLRAAHRQRAGALATTLVIVLVAVNLRAGWSVRPQIFSYSFFALLLALLDSCFVANRLRHPLWLLFSWPLFAVWANTHGGFLAGLGVFGLYLVGRAIETVARDGRRGLGTAVWLAVIVLGGAAATLLTPYGVELWRWLIGSLGPPRPEIPEWVALSWTDAKFVPFAALAVLTAVALIFSRGPRDAVQIVVLLATGAQAVAHQRHIPFFALAAEFWISGAVGLLLGRSQEYELLPYDAAPHPNPLPLGEGTDQPRFVNLVFCLACLVLAVPLIFRLEEIPVERGEWPVSAVQFMADENLGGKLVVTFNWAQYALAALPGASVAFDGRYDTCYPPEVVDIHFDFVLGNDPARRWRNPTSPAFDPARVLAFWRPDLVLIQRSQQPAVEVMQARADWVLLYQDAIAQLWGRRDDYDDSASPRYLAPVNRQISDAPQTGSVPWPAFPAIN